METRFLTRCVLALHCLSRFLRTKLLQITRDLMQPKYGYPRWLNLIALWMIAIIPLTKFGLCSRPVSHMCASLTRV